MFRPDRVPLWTLGAHLLEAMSAHSVPTLVYASTIMALYQGETYRPLNLYAAATGRTIEAHPLRIHLGSTLAVWDRPELPLQFHARPLGVHPILHSAAPQYAEAETHF